MKKAIWVILLLFLVGVAIGYYMYNKPVGNYANTKSEMTLTPAELVSAYETNEQEADTRYVGKIIEVSGKIANIDQAADGSVILLLDSGNPVSSVMCSLDPKVSQQTSGLAAGQTVRLKGVCTGFTTDVVLDKCVLIN